MRIQANVLAVTVMLLVTLESQASYDPHIGRFASRDPIEEHGGPNLYGFLDNQAINKFDPIGLCPSCGVQFFQLVSRRWITDPKKGQYQHEFDIRITFKKGDGYDPKCCKYVQYAKSMDVVNGDAAKKNVNGMPLDGLYHVDKLNWQDDSINNLTGGAYQDIDPSDVNYLALDAPGYSYGKFKFGDSIHFAASIRGRILDVCNGNKIVKVEGIEIEIKGIYPFPLNFTPRP